MFSLKPLHFYYETIIMSIIDGPTPVGRLLINRVSQLSRIAGNVAPSHVNPTLLDLEADSDNEDEATGNIE